MINQDVPEEEKQLGNEIRSLFNQAISYRFDIGVTNSLRINHVVDNHMGEVGDSVHSKGQQKDRCSCVQPEVCSNCDPLLANVCSISDTLDFCNEHSVFSQLSELLSTVKQYEYISLFENVYAPMGNKPFSLKSIGKAVPSKEENEKAAKSFYAALDNFLVTNQVRVDEILDAFNLNTMSDLTVALSDSVNKEADQRADEDLKKNEIVIERDFNRINVMTEYLEMLRDTCTRPVAGLWCTTSVQKKTKTNKNGKLTWSYKNQPIVERIDPDYFWVTPDYRVNKPGRAVFRLIQLTYGDIRRFLIGGNTNTTKLDRNINNFLAEYEHGYRFQEASLFRDYWLVQENLYDVLVTRGQYKKEHLESLGVPIDPLYKDENFVPCEIHYSGNTVLKCEVLKFDDDLGVYMTRFRRNGDSVFGFSLQDFIRPYAKLYQSTIDAMDVSVGKTIGTITQIDTAVIDDVDKTLKRDKDGVSHLDLSADNIIEFDSSAAYNLHNFKGVPITMDTIPSNLSTLLPMLDVVFTQLEKLTGIPQILVNANNISSALRTTSNFNASYESSAKVIQSLLRESETRVLKPMVLFFFDNKASAGDFKGYLTEFEPVVLTSDTLTTEQNNDTMLAGDLTELTATGLVPQETLSALLNTVGREVYNLDVDLVPDVGTLSTKPVTQPTQV